MSDMKSPLARLVLFMVCLSVAGAFMAGVHYVVIDRPQQEYASNPPTNYLDCTTGYLVYYFCFLTPGGITRTDQKTGELQCCVNK
jgi:hypothetical protein